MRLAFAVENDDELQSIISEHFAKARYFVFLDVKGQKIERINSKENPYLGTHGPGIIPQFIKDNNADVMVSGGMGAKAIGYFNDFGIQAITGLTGNIEDNLPTILSGDTGNNTSCTGH